MFNENRRRFLKTASQIIFVTLFGSALEAKNESGACANALGKITIGSFNMYNLFDPSKEIGKDDRRPDGLRPWVVDEQIERIATHIEKAGKPEILVGTEIENENVAHQLGMRLGYQHFYMTKSPDRRGIDVAVFYNRNNLIRGARARGDFWQTDPIFKTHPTRDLLLVDLDVAGNRLMLLLNHWPSLHNPPEFRRAAAKRAREVILAQKQRFPDATIVALGDFNTHPGDKDTEGLNSYDDVLLTDKVVAGPQLFDAYTALSAKRKAELPPGTYFYVPRPEPGKPAEKPSWNPLDRMAVLEGSSIVLDRESFNIVVPPEGHGSERHPDSAFLVPVGFYFSRGADGKTNYNNGISDHFMVTATFVVLKEGGEALSDPPTASKVMPSARPAERPQSRIKK